MNGERWQRVEELYHAALECPPHKRAAFLREACPDADVRREVESLIESDPAGQSVLDQPVWERRLAVGERLGPYEILAQIGAGGMGEVWKARDTRLDRMVAIKVCAQRFSARFEREARAIAALNHPNICTLHDVGPNYLVMEYVEGQPLRGPLPVAKAIEYARQILGGLAAAHRKGIVHRDLKPANVLVTRSGVKLLDFGLAKHQPSAAAAESAETATMGVTDQQVIMGTPPYMAPEQIEAKPVDNRTDIFAFGCVLYELLTGQRAFEGKSAQSTMAAVLAGEPTAMSKLRPGIPVELDRIVRACLAKDPQERLQTARDVRWALDWALEATPASRPAGRRYVWAALVAILGMAAIVGWWRVSRSVDRPLVLLSVDLGPDALPGARTTAAISPDGHRLVFPVRGPDGKEHLAIRRLDQAQTTLLADTGNGRDPFFSPDSQWIGFFADHKLKKVPVQGGPPITLCSAPRPYGASWGEDGTIVATLAEGSPLWHLSSSGGTPVNLTKLSGGEVTHRWPQILPGGKAVLFTASSTLVGLEEANIVAVMLKTGLTGIVQRGGYYGRYLPSGHLLYVHQGVLFGVAFDADRLKTRGTPVPLLENIAANSGAGGGQFDFSRNGTLVYLPGKGNAESRPILWIDRSGKTKPLLSTPGVYSQCRLSPDGKRVALVASSRGNDIFVFDWQQDALTRLTFDGHSGMPIWHPDGKHIAFQSTAAGFGLSWVRSDGAGEPQRLLESQHNLYPWSFSPDGRLLAYHQLYPNPGDDIWTLRLDTADPDHPKPGKSELFLRTAADNQAPVFSPDGRWIAYRSSEWTSKSQASQVYVRPFPGPGGKWQISEDGGNYAHWSQNAHELFYTAPDSRIMVVNYTVKGNSFIAGKPRPWSDSKWSDVDLSPDGKRFIGLPLLEAPGPQAGSVRVIFLQNFFDELRRKIPTEK
jgi:serine/threonine-protein kinase